MLKFFPLVQPGCPPFPFPCHVPLAFCSSACFLRFPALTHLSRDLSGVWQLPVLWPLLLHRPHHSSLSGFVRHQLGECPSPPQCLHQRASVCGPTPVGSFLLTSFSAITCVLFSKLALLRACCNDDKLLTCLSEHPPSDGDYSFPPHAGNSFPCISRRFASRQVFTQQVPRIAVLSASVTDANLVSASSPAAHAIHNTWNSVS